MWIGLLGLAIGLFAPIGCVLFVIPISGKHFLGDTHRATTFFGGWLAICVVLYLLNIIDPVHTLNLTIGAGASCLLMFYMLNRGHDLPMVFLSLLVVNTIFIALRQYLYAEQMIAEFALFSEKALGYIGERYATDTPTYQNFADSITKSQEIYADYNSGWSIASTMLCLMTGYFYFARKVSDLTSISFYQTHIYVIYSLLGALAVAIFPTYRLYAINYLIAIAPLFMMQGLGVIAVRYGGRLTRSPLLIALVALCILFNLYLIIIITSILGLADCWFDFRKLTKSEELNENHSDGNT